MEPAESFALDKTAFLAVSFTFQGLLLAKVAWNCWAHRRKLYAQAVRVFTGLLKSLGKERALTHAEKLVLAEEISQLRLRMARRYSQVLAATCFTFVLSIQWNLILDLPRWMTTPLSWLVLGIFVLLAVVQLLPCMLSRSTLEAWYIAGIGIIAVGSLPIFVPAEHLTTVSVIALVLFRLPFAIMAQHPLLIIAGNLVIAGMICLRTTLKDFSQQRMGASFTIQVEVSCSLMVITMSFLLQSALRHIAQQMVRNTKSSTELNAASVPWQEVLRRGCRTTRKAVERGCRDMRVSEIRGTLLGSSLQGNPSIWGT